MSLSKRKHLYMPGLLARVRSQYEKIKDSSVNSQFSLKDCLMSGIAMFGLKYPSLLQFDEDARTNERVRHNLEHLYQVNLAPSDTQFRKRLDPVEPRLLQRGIDRIIAQLQRGKVLETYRFMDEYLLVAIDGSGYFSSHDVYCEQCCVKNHRDGSKSYYHQILAAVIAHPEYRQVFPLMLEPIIKQDGSKKNDCEHSALKRLLINLKRAHPHLKLLVTLDGLYADGVIIKLLKDLGIYFIITAHESDLPYLYEFYQASKKDSLQIHNDEYKRTELNWANKLPLNATHHECEINLLLMNEEKTTKKKKKTTFYRCAWLTNLSINTKTAQLIMQGGRTRWHIENDTFNTLKNQGYQFEHNFGHGKQNLNVVLAYLMFTAFLIDQIQEFTCKHFQAALKKAKRLKYLWEKIRSYFSICTIDTWDELYAAIAHQKGIKISALFNSS